MVLMSPRDYYLLPSFLVLAGNPLAGPITEALPTLSRVLWNAMDIREKGAGSQGQTK